MYEIGRIMAVQLLVRPKQQDFLAFESILISDINRLRVKGYNVDRILRQRHFEAKVAERERQKQLEEENRREAERAKNKEFGHPPAYQDPEPQTPRQSVLSPQIRPADTNGQVAAQSPPGLPHMPGSFQLDSPEQPAPLPNGNLDETGRKKSILQQVSKRFGLRDHGNRPASPAGPTGPHQVTDPAQIQQNLTSAIQACRSHDSSHLFSQPTTSVVEEAAKGSYCDESTGQDISFVAACNVGVKVYVANHIPNKTNLVTSNMIQINLFGGMLLDLASVFNLPPQTIHIFHDDNTKCIAFNRQGALFCNYHFFQKLHYSNYGVSSEKRRDALSYWWVTLCHELAHNIVHDHSAAHSFYAESFAQNYFNRILAKAAQY